MTRDFFGDNAVFSIALFLFDFALVQTLFDFLGAFDKLLITRSTFFAESAFKIEQGSAGGCKFCA